MVFERARHTCTHLSFFDVDILVGILLYNFQAHVTFQLKEELRKRRIETIIITVNDRRYSIALDMYISMTERKKKELGNIAGNSTRISPARVDCSHH